jgi:pyruvate formate-lyase activating enzyme-like uncharacterized protein
MGIETTVDVRARLIAGNRQEYGEGYEALRFPSPDEAQRATERRDGVLSDLKGRVESGFGGTKLDCADLSPGCRICGEGGWSCLFISGRCNCSCFYCPTSQDVTGVPTTNAVEFRTPADYVGYLERFAFAGASISGGEPLLTPARTLAFVTAIKKRFGDGLHLWLYTNGTLVDGEILARLRDAGLDEIRFDIGATDYHLHKLRLAVGVIPTVTVEIPAVPEDVPLLKERMVEMGEAGVDYLNLHQLRLTPHNYPHLAARNYTFLHGEKVTVLDSELAALELLNFSIDRKLGLPVNYCSFVYKNRYQGRASRLRNAPFLLKGHEALTGNGYIRTLTLLSAPEAVARQGDLFRAQGADPALWNSGTTKERLLFSPLLWPLVEFGTCRLLIGYAAARQLSAMTYRNPYVSVRVGETKQVVIERSRVGQEFELSDGEITAFAGAFLGGGTAQGQEFEGILSELAGYERTPEGLQDYY